MRQPYLGGFRITKLYGTPPPPGFHYAAGKHSGLDLVGDNTEIRAIADGTVYKTGNDTDGWGRYLVVKQADGLYAIYCHLSKLLKSAGQAVRAGDWIGNEGATGQVTGQHLHLELRKNYADKYSTIDPADYLGLKNKKGRAEVVEVEKTIAIILNGKQKKVVAIEKNGNNFVKLQDLRDDKIEVGYSDGKPVVRVK